MMPKFIIRWNTGYGDSCEVIEADTFEEAEIKAYDSWREETENNSDYEAMEYTEENCDDFGLEWEDKGETP
jgi:hypothetical protein